MSNTHLAEEDTLRKNLSRRVGQLLGPILELLEGSFSTAHLGQRFQAIRHRLNQGLSVIGGPSMETSEDFQEALNQWVQNQTSGGLHLIWQKIGTWPDWSEQEYRDALLILCEACSNARKHGLATEVKVLVRGWEEGFSITVEDNGKGFPEELTKTDGAGMGTMKLRAQRFQAQFFMMNRQPNGAVVGWTKDPSAETEPIEEIPINFSPGKRLGMELHDHLCQHLVALMVEMELLREELPEEAAEDWLLLQDAEERLRSAHHEIREWSHTLIETNQLPDSASA